MSALASRPTCPPCSTAAVERVAGELELSPVTAAVLVRRGYDTVAAAERFLTADERHDPFQLAGMDAACELVLGHVERGSAIVVHGDYDVDGVCSTALLVGALRTLGADPSWHLPSRFDEGYGLALATVERLVASGAGLLITVDCGITSLAEVEHARALGLDVLVTDHHRVADRLPVAPVLHPAIGDYGCPDLCATGVVHKLAESLYVSAGHDRALAERDLDLVALATVADLVPLTGENRRLVREGLPVLAKARRPGLRALMRTAGVEPERLDAAAVGYRLAPRMNAAGRLRRADAALDLLLIDDDGRAAAVADELEVLNRERRDTETRILFAAEAARAEHADAPAYVLAGEGWHPGVIGIVASRMVDRHHRPCVMIALDGDSGRGSARSIPGYDLHAALGDCASHLSRFGGHRMAAGLELGSEQVEPFRRALAAHAAAALSPTDLQAVERVDALTGVGSLDLELAQELERLGPFGQGNPAPTLLVPGAAMADVRALGEDGQHARYTLAGAGARARGVAFRTGPRALVAAAEGSRNVAVRLEANEWHGALEPRLVLRALAGAGEATERRDVDVVGEEPFAAGFERERRGPPAAQPPSVQRGGPPAAQPDRGGAGPKPRRLHDARGRAFAALAGGLVSSGERVLVICADVARRRTALGDMLAGVADLCDPPAPAPALCSWPSLERAPGLAEPFHHVMALDPPPAAWGEDLLAGLPAPAPTAPAWAHLAWGPAEAGFALAVAEAELDVRGALAEVYRALRAAHGGACEELRRLLEGDGRYPRSGAHCGRLVRVLEELGLVSYSQGGPAGPSCLILDAPRTSLDRSATAVECAQRLAASREYLLGQGAPAAPAVVAAAA